MNEALSILRKKTKYQLSEIKNKKKIVAKRLQTAQGEIKHGIFWRSLVQCAARRSFYHLKKQCLPLTKKAKFTFFSLEQRILSFQRSLKGSRAYPVM